MNSTLNLKYSNSSSIVEQDTDNAPKDMLRRGTYSTATITKRVHNARQGGARLPQTQTNFGTIIEILTKN